MGSGLPSQDHNTLPSAGGGPDSASDQSGQTVPSLYRRALGARYEVMPAALRALHDMNGGRASGRAEIDGAATWPGRLLARLIGFPPPGEDVPVTVEFVCRDGGEIWSRSFSGWPLRSAQYLGRGRWKGRLVERFGVLAFAMAVPVSHEGLALKIVAGRCLGLPIPRLALPRVEATERMDEQGRFRFAVEIGLPLLGRLVSYRGWLEPIQSTKRSARLASGTMQAS